MQFEVMKKSHKKEVIIGVIVLVIIAIVFIVQLSFAKYQTVKNMTIVSGTIDYSLSDFEIIAMYQQKADQTCTESSCYDAITKMPGIGYAINESKSYCNINNTKDPGARLYTNSEWEHVMIDLQRGSKCYVYFDRGSIIGGSIIEGSNGILKNITVKTGTPNFSKVATTDEGVYKAKDESGNDSYYWRGAVTNNYVKFANKFWRIIRINGDGTIRIIYDGETARANGTTLTVETSAFNTTNSNNMYVGFRYTSGQVHGLGTESTILKQLNTWYTTNLASYASKIDIYAGFCGDRTPYICSDFKCEDATSGGGTGKTATYYGVYIRLFRNKAPVLTCPTEDFYTMTGWSVKGNKSLTYPIGLITADEVAMAGGLSDALVTSNSSYYLYTGKSYWTMSPNRYDSSSSYPAAMYVVTGSEGRLTYGSVTTSGYGVRPVINLKADVKLTGKGTASDPYIVQ